MPRLVLAALAAVLLSFAAIWGLRVPEAGRPEVPRRHDQPGDRRGFQPGFQRG